MKAKVDKEKCIGCGLCEAVCPEVFKMNEDGIAEALDKDIDAKEAESVEEAKSQCPAEAIETE